MHTLNSSQIENKCLYNSAEQRAAIITDISTTQLSIDIFVQ